MSDLADKIRERLTKHFIVQIECSHPVDRAHCICGWISPWAKNVGAAGELWVEHALSREVVLGLVAGAREAIVKEIVALLEHEHGWKLQVPAGDLEPPIKGCWCGFKCDGLDEFNEHLLTVARAAMTSDRYGKQDG